MISKRQPKRIVGLASAALVVLLTGVCLDLPRASGSGGAREAISSQPAIRTPTKPSAAARAEEFSAGGTTPRRYVGPERLTATVRPTPPPQPDQAPRFEPRATPTPAPLPLIDNGASWFGPGVILHYYDVSGATADQINASIATNGPWSTWLGGRAAAISSPTVHIEVSTLSVAGNCQVLLGQPAYWMNYAVTLPAWRPSNGRTAVTVEWWNQTIRNIAAHEAHHIAIYEDGAADMRAQLAAASCGGIEGLIATGQAAMREANCDYDMASYGASVGLSKRACVGAG